MKNTYVLKYTKEKFTTTKNNILVNSDEYWNILFGFPKYRYIYFEQNKHKKKIPKELIIEGDKMKFFPPRLFFVDFPVEKITINCSFGNDSPHFKNSYYTKIIELTNNANRTIIKEDLGIDGIEKIIIPYAISSCKFFKTNSNFLIIKYDEIDHVIELDECLFNKEKDICIIKNEDKLNIRITRDNIDIEYNVCLENNELKSIKKYNKYEISLNKNYIEELNIIDLKKKYNEIFFKDKCFHIKKLVLSKNDLEYLLKVGYEYLDEIEIIDDNNMSLFPRTLSIKLDEKQCEYIRKLELLDNNLLIKTYNLNYKNRYFIINKDLSLINIDNARLGIGEPIINKVILDYDTEKFLYKDKELTIPFNEKIKNITNSYILNYFVKNAENIVVRKNNKEYKIHCFNNYLSDIIYKTDESFEIEILHKSLREKQEVFTKVLSEFKFDESQHYKNIGKVLRKDISNNKMPRRY